MPTGHLEKNPTGGYYAIADFGRNPVTGERDRLKRAAKDPINGKKLNKADSNTFLLDMLANPDKYRNNEPAEPLPPPKELTFGELLLDWLVDHVRRRRKKRISVGTEIGYRRIIDVYLFPNLGHIIANKLNESDLDQYYTKLMAGELPGQKEEVGERTAFSHHSLISTALTWAVKKSLIEKNPAKIVEPPNKSQRVIMNAKTEDEVQDFLDFLKNTPEYPLFYTDFFSGLRRSELLGLTEYSLSSEALRVDQAILKYKAEELEAAGDRWIDEFIAYMPGRYTKEQLLLLHEKGYVIKNPKSEKGVRDIPWDEEDYAILQAVITRNKINKLRYGKAYNDYKLIFCRENGLPLLPNSVSKKMKQYADKFGFTMRLHDIRHTFVTLLLKNRTRPNVAQELAGHKHASTTLDIYGHVLPGEKEEAISAMKSKLRKTQNA